MVRPLDNIHQRGGTPIFMATTATPIILATTVTILSTPPCLATGTITKLARRGAVMTRSRLVERQPRAGTLTQRRHAHLIGTEDPSLVQAKPWLDSRHNRRM